jgi:voltage-gated potassium channel
MDEVMVQPNSPIAGKSLVESNFRQSFDAIADSDTLNMVFNPGPLERIKPNDTLIVMDSSEMILRLKKDGCTAI